MNAAPPAEDARPAAPGPATADAAPPRGRAGAWRPALAALLVVVAVAGLGRIATREIVGHAETRASDALPLYLSGAAVAAGLDPTEEASLATVYDQRGLSVGAATFSTLYPATTGVLLRPLASLSWAGFTDAWRWTLLGAVAALGAAAAAVAGGDASRRAAWGGATASVLAWHPVTAECVRLGQVNLLLGALAALAMAAVAAAPAGRWRPELAAGALLGLGAALKLVPAALLAPLLAGRQWRPAAGAAVVGGAVLLLALGVTPLPALVDAILGTLRFQAAIDPDWLVGRTPAPSWMQALGWVRHEPLQWITLGASVILPLARPSTRTRLAGMALLTAWLGADAAGFHMLYAPLAYPVFVLLTGDARAFGALALAFYALAAVPADLGPEPRMVLFGLCAWLGAAWALARGAAAVAPGPLEADAEATQAGVALAGVVTGALLLGAMPGEGPVAAPLPEGQRAPDGRGFIHAGDRVPGEVRALGAGLDRPASTLARPGTIRDLQLYMRAAPVQWRALAERYPARATLLRGRADAAPAGDLRDHSGRSVAAWLVEETETVARLRAEGIDLGTLPGALDRALASGLTDPELEASVPQDPP